MKKTFFLLALATVSSGFLLAQPTLQMNVVPDIGDVVTIQEADTNNVNPGNPGANQTWNFANLQPLSGSPATQYIYLAPSNTPPQYATKFPAANLAVKINSDTIVYGYSKKETNQYSLLGIKNAFIEQLYPNPDIQLKTLSYNGSFTDDFTNYTDAGTGIVFYAAGSRTVKYDAYGTLTTPTGTYQNAMRIKSVSNQVDSAEFSGIKIINRTDITTYDWLLANYPGVLLSIYYIHTINETSFIGLPIPPTITDLGTTKNVNYIAGLSTSIFDRPDELAGVRVSLAGSNPAVDLLAVQIAAEAGSENLQILLTDVNGRVLETRSLSVVAGENRIELPVGHLSAGAYFLTVTDGKSVRTLNWQKL